MQALGPCDIQSSSGLPLSPEPACLPGAKLVRSLQGRGPSWPQNQHGRDGARPTMGPPPMEGHAPSWPPVWENRARVKVEKTYLYQPRPAPQIFLP